MLNKYEIRIRKNNEILRIYIPSVKKLSELLNQTADKDIIGVYKLRFSEGVVIGSDRLDWRFRGGNLSLKTVKKSKVLPSYILPLTQEQIDELTEKVLGKTQPVKESPSSTDYKVNTSLFRHRPLARPPLPRSKSVLQGSQSAVRGSKSKSLIRGPKSVIRGSKSGVRNSKSKLSSSTRVRKTRRG